MTTPALLAVFAHPDDEAFSIGGTLRRYASEGCDVYLVTATRGEAGQIADPALASAANLPFVREQELRCACEVYGIHPPLFLDYVDGQLAVVNQGQAVGKLVRIVRQLRPQVLITYGPDGIYGHYDHIAVHRWATIAYDLAADPQCFPEQSSTACAPHRIQKLYWSVASDDLVSILSHDGAPASVMMDGVPFAMIGYPKERITTWIDIGQHVDAKLRGLLCHATQFDARNAGQEEQRMLENPLFQREPFILARSRLTPLRGVEVDLLDGLR